VNYIIHCNLNARILLLLSGNIFFMNLTHVSAAISLQVITTYFYFRNASRCENNGGFRELCPRKPPFSAYTKHTHHLK